MPSVVEQILNLARWAPSGDNTQPWRFEILDERHILVHGFDTREHCIYDLNGFGSQLAHGALVETISIAASGFQLRAEISRRADTRETHPLYDVKLYPVGQMPPDPLLPFIEHRCTQRRSLHIQSLTQREKQALATNLGNSYTVLWIEGWRGRWAISRLLFASARIRLTIPEAYDVHRAVIQWNAQFSEDRMPDAAIGLDPVTLRLMQWAMVSWKRVDFLNTYLAGHLFPRIELDLLPALRCAAHFVLIRNEEPQGIDDHVEAGRALQRFWLTATQLGLQFQPEMTPLIFSQYAHHGVSFSKVAPAAQRAKDLAIDLEKLIGVSTSKVVFMGRVGFGRPPKARSMRLSLDKLLQFSSAAKLL